MILFHLLANCLLISTAVALLRPNVRMNLRLSAQDDDEIAREYYRCQKKITNGNEEKSTKLKPSLFASLPPGMTTPVLSKVEQEKLKKIEEQKEDEKLSDLDILRKEMKKLIESME